MTASARIIIYLTPAEKKQFTAHAKKAKKTVSTHGLNALKAYMAPARIPMPSDI